MLLAGSGFAAALANLGPAREGQTLRGCLDGCFRSPRKARALGERYLAQNPQAADRRALRARLGLDGAPVSPTSLRARIANLRQRDFEQARIVEVDGWVVAQSEAEICALLSLG